MTDVVDSRTRSKMMSGIRGKDTQPELLVRKALFRRGFRYRLHDRNLPGCPDLVFPKYRAVIFVNGCFWHQHYCHLFRWPKTRREFWEVKLKRNAAADLRAFGRLMKDGWRIMVIWECALKGRTKRPFDEVIQQATTWLRFGERYIDMGGMGDDHR